MDGIYFKFFREFGYDSQGDLSLKYKVLQVFNKTINLGGFQFIMTTIRDQSNFIEIEK